MPVVAVHTRWILVVAMAFVTTAQHMPHLYRTMYEAQRGPLTAPISSNVSKICVDEFNSLLFNKTSSVISALDAFGKPEAGFLAANWHWYGHFSECVNLTDYKYCLLNIQANATRLGKKFNNTIIQLEWGVCAPKKCSNLDVHNSVETLLEFLHLQDLGLTLLNATAATSCVEKPVIPYSVGFYVCLVICAILVLFMVLGSCIDTFERKRAEKKNDLALSIRSDDVIAPLLNGTQNGDIPNYRSSITPFESNESGWKRVTQQTFYGIRLMLLDFAVNRNLTKLLKVGIKSDRNIDCLNGIRVISMLWVILGHIFFFPFEYGGINNILDPLSWSKKFFFLTILNAFFAVDTFFFLSGFLVSYISLIKMDKRNGKLPWFWFYLHRYIRLTPVLAIVMLFWMYLAPHAIWGPRAGIFTARPNCPDYWWANLLYIQNFYPPKFGKACIAWSWYLANDMQFYIISPLLLVTLYKKPWIGLSLIGVLMGMSFATTAGITAYFDLGSSPVTSSSMTDTTVDYGNVLYQKPYVRLPPYLIGVLLGYFFYKVKDKRITISRPILGLGWILASTIGISVIYGVYGNFIGHPLGKAANIAYEVLSRCAWGVFLSWVVVSCKYGRSGWINDILSWNLWVPMSRLTYTAYLLHPILIMTFIGNFGQSYYFSMVLQVFYFFALVLMSYICAMVLSLAVEFPLANIEKHFMPKM